MKCALRHLSSARPYVHVNDGQFKTERLVHNLLKRYWILSARRVIQVPSQQSTNTKYNDLNLQAGEKELKLADKEWNAEKDILAYAAHQDIEWHFWPPHEPHFGVGKNSGAN